MPSDLVLALKDQINDPEEIRFTLYGEELVIRPMSADAFNAVSDRIFSIATTVLSSGQSVESDNPTLDAKGVLALMKGRKIAELIELFKGPLVQACTTDAHIIIGSALKHTAPKIEDEVAVGADWVARRIFLDQRVLLLRLIFEAEGVKHIMGEVGGLRSDVQPEMTVLEATDEDSTLPLPEPPSPADLRPISHLRSGKNSATPESSTSSTTSSTNDSPKQEKPARNSKPRSRKTESAD